MTTQFIATLQFDLTMNSIQRSSSIRQVVAVGSTHPRAALQIELNRRIELNGQTGLDRRIELNRRHNE